MRVCVCELTRGSWPESQREMTYKSTGAEADKPQRHDGAEECTGGQVEVVVKVLHDNNVNTRTLSYKVQTCRVVMTKLSQEKKGRPVSAGMAVFTMLGEPMPVPEEEKLL